MRTLDLVRPRCRTDDDADYIQRLVDEAPPLTPGQKAELQAILSTAGEPDLNAAGLDQAGEQ